jgi:NAD(P)-dependent dehydrogenase (short-subunit alcohol dehydrogenase family)
MGILARRLISGLGLGSAVNHRSADGDPAEWREMILTNVLGSALPIRAALAGLKQTRWRILPVGSIVGLALSQPLGVDISTVVVRPFGQPVWPGPRAQITAVIPPSTAITWPLTKSEAGAASQTRVPTRSSARPHRPAGVRRRSQASNSGSSARARVKSVTT